MNETELKPVSSAPTDSPYWYRVARLVPRLRPTVRVRHRGSGEQIRHVLCDTLSGRHYLLDEASWQFVGRFDGQRTVGEIWSWLGDHASQAPTQLEVLDWLANLDTSGVLQCDKLPDLQALMRGQTKRERRRRQASLNPLSWRVPLGDPSRLLAHFDPVLDAVTHPLSMVLLLGLVVLAVMQAAMSWSSLVADASDRLHSPSFLALSWVMYPVIKALHELGHALAMRHYGAEVRHVGMGFLYLVPAPYVDASAAAGLALSRQRMVISASGVLVELVLAALGILVWSWVEPGTVRDLGLAVAMVGGVSTVMANANPLVRMDGYHILTDGLDLPNLGPRSRRWWLDSLRQWFSGVPWDGWPTGTWLQKVVTCCYAPASWLFGVVVAFSVGLWLSGTAALLALVVGGLSLWLLVLKPLVIGGGWVLWAPELVGRRVRALLGSAFMVGGTLAAVLWLPLPHATVAEGLAWMPEEALIRAPADGFVALVSASTDHPVDQGGALLTLHNEELPVELARVRAQRLELEVSGHQLQLHDPAAAQRAQVQVEALLHQETELNDRIGQLQMNSQRKGMVSWIDPDTLLGRYVKRGDVLGYVLARDQDHLVARTVVPGEQVAHLLKGVQGVGVLLPDRGSVAVPGRWDGVVPATVSALPAATLGVPSGGSIETDPQDSEGLRTRSPVAVIDVQVPSLLAQRLGSRLTVRFDHGSQPLAQRLLQQAQQLVLKHLGDATDVPGGR